MQVRFLNLDRSEDRRITFLNVNRHLTNPVRVAATDGFAYSRQDLRDVHVLANEMPGYTDGAIGCALSHLGEWELASKTNSVLTLAEDDAILHHQFEPLAEAVLASLPADWDIIQWGLNFDSILAFDLLPGVSPCVGVFDQASLRANTAAFQNLPLRPTTYRLQRSLGTLCQSVSPRGAAKLLKHCLPIRPMDAFYPILNRILPNTGIDSMMNELYPRINAYVCLPPLAITRNEHAHSTVQKSIPAEHAEVPAMSR